MNLKQCSAKGLLWTFYLRFDARLEFLNPYWTNHLCEKHYCNVHGGHAVQFTLSRTWFSHWCNINAQLVRHEAEDREDCKARNKAGRTVHETQGECISGIRKEEHVQYTLRHPQTAHYEFGKYVLCLLVAVVVVFIVASQGWQTANAHSIGEKNLTRSIHPHLKTVQLHKVFVSSVWRNSVA